MKIKNYIKENKLKMAFLIYIISFSLFLMLFLKMDIDYFWHFKAGEYMVNNKLILTNDVFSWSLFNYSWISHEWLFEIFIYILFLLFGKFHLFIYAFSLVLVLILFLFFTQKKEYLKNVPFSLLWLSFFTLIFTGISGRPQLFSFLFLAISLWLIFYYFYHPDSKRIFFLPIITILWANVHGGSSNLPYLLCLLVGVVGLFQFNFSKIEAKRISKKQFFVYILVAILCILSISINPHGFKMIIYPYQNMADTVMLSNIMEWQPTNLNKISHYIYFIFAFFVFLVMIFSKKKIRFLDSIIYIFFLYLGLKSIRFWFFSYIAWNFFVFYYIPKRKLDNNTCLILIFSSILFLLIFINKFSYSSVINDKTLSQGAIEVLKEEKPKRLFNYYDYGGYLIYRDIPVFIDGRADLYSKYLFEDYLSISNLSYDFVNLINHYNFDYFIVPINSGIYSYLNSIDSYQIIYADNNCSIFKTN